MDITINPIEDRLTGTIIAPPSKSYSHRAFIVASLTDGVSVIKNPLVTGDVEVTINILKLLGINIVKECENSYLVEKTAESFKSIKKSIDCKNSGTSIRIFSALSFFVKEGLSLKGEFLKRNRPIIPLLEALKSLGGEYKLKEGILHIERKNFQCNTVKIRGDISSQFITALLLVSPLLKCDDKEFIEIEVTTPLLSYPYIKITIDILNSFGINIYEELNAQKIGKYFILGNQRYRPQTYTIPGDFSSAAFIITATVLSSEESRVIIKNLDVQNPQGDKRIIEILHDMGADIEINEDKNQIIVKGGTTLQGRNIDCSEIPDLFPILSVLGAFADGKTTLYNASNLRLKESDRISVMARELAKMGIRIKEKEDKLTIYHTQTLNGTLFNHANDHRVAMACCIAALFANDNSKIEKMDIIEDSYPTFIDDLNKLGAKIR
ncbi:MAG: 3-phosphoshikimate 1-carboxyvinyltransferase [Promethearchaeota archaeon]|nr:MAG: 3-phosphoshikimate 1-carboxyvinyltransferase [Candidatus Lokiarchaeota archaeon]